MVQGLLPTLLVGLVGGALAEVIRLAGPLAHGKGPTKLPEYLGSFAYVITGAAVLLYVPWDTPHTPLEVAAAGAAVPALFPAAVRSAGSIRDSIGGRGWKPRLATTANLEITQSTERDRTFPDYMTSYF